MKTTTDIGFIAALAPKKEAPPPPPGAEPKGPGTYFEIVGAELGDLTAIFDFPGLVGAGAAPRPRARVAEAVERRSQESDVRLRRRAGVAAGGGLLRILDDIVLPFDRVAINRVATTPERPDDILLDLEEAATGRTKLVGKGFFTGIYGATSVPGIKLHAEFAQPGDALTAVVEAG